MSCGVSFIQVSASVSAAVRSGVETRGFRSGESDTLPDYLGLAELSFCPFLEGSLDNYKDSSATTLTERLVAGADMPDFGKGLCIHRSTRTLLICLSSCLSVVAVVHR
jgi:hypothetical protein